MSPSSTVVTNQISKISENSLRNEQNDQQDILIDMKELCHKTALSKAWFYEMISEKRLPFPVYRFGRAVRFKSSDVDAWVQNHRQN